ncbi:MAG: type I glyceraldehyde-3-phosphate dehydrogenase [Idiomarina sp.]|nr:type I glyceraldehyde-3-phosphate dehydrogenase [Idiomarina sp.]
MTIKIAINGFGRIGKNIVRALYERDLHNELEVVAINDLGQPEVLAHLLQFDTVHGRFDKPVSSSHSAIHVGSDTIKVLSERDPEQLPWTELGVDVVLECTGLFTQREDAQKHINAGARKVIISAPGKDVDATVVYGVNHETLTNDMTIISNASCTTNCLAPIAKPLHDALTIESGLMTTVHAYTNDQRLTDSYHSDLQRARAAAQSMIPSKTGAAAAVGLVIPELQGRFDGLAVRVPTPNVSLVDLSFIASRDTSINEVNQVIRDAATNEHMHGVLEINELPLVSSDYNHNSHSSIFDARQTRVNGRLVKVMAWYDNEWGFSNRMLDNAVALMNAPSKKNVTKSKQDVAESY